MTREELVDEIADTVEARGDHTARTVAYAILMRLDSLGYVVVDAETARDGISAQLIRSRP